MERGGCLLSGISRLGSASGWVLAATVGGGAEATEGSARLDMRPLPGVWGCCPPAPGLWRLGSLNPLSCVYELVTYLSVTFPPPLSGCFLQDGQQFRGRSPIAYTCSLGLSNTVLNSVGLVLLNVEIYKSHGLKSHFSL